MLPRIEEAYGPVVSEALSWLVEGPIDQDWFAGSISELEGTLDSETADEQALQLIRYMLEQDLLVLEFIEPTERHPRDFVRYDDWTPEQQIALLRERWQALGPLPHLDFIVDIEPTVKGNRRAVAEQAARGWFPRWYSEPYEGHGRWVRANGSAALESTES